MDPCMRAAALCSPANRFSAALSTKAIDFDLIHFSGLLSLRMPFASIKSMAYLYSSRSATELMRYPALAFGRSTFIAGMTIIVALLLSCGGEKSTPSTPTNQLLSILLDTPNSSAPTQAGIDAATSLALGTGAEAVVLTYTWSSLEAQPGQIDLSVMRSSLSYFHGKGLKCYLGIQVINTVKREVPPDLAITAFNDPVFIARFHALLDAIRPLLTSNDLYLSIGNEVDVYLQANPAEWSTYLAFYDATVQYVHQTTPNIQVGVTTTFGGYSRESVQQVHALNSSSDVVLLTYYPLGTGTQVGSANSPTADLPHMLSLADGKSVVLQEAGYPSGTLNASSEQLQAQFVTSLIAAWRTAGNRMPLLNYFILYDFDAKTCADLDVYYGLQGDSAFISYLCTLGLRRSDGTEKPAWGAFVSASH